MAGRFRCIRGVYCAHADKKRTTGGKFQVGAKIGAMTPQPTIGFDTRGVNRLEDGGAQSEPLMKALYCGFTVQLPAMAVDEILATPAKKNPRRENLFARCQRLLASGQCLWPPHWIIKQLVLAHSKNASRFDWTFLPVRARFYERAIIDRDFTEELCDQQRNEQFELEERYAKVWANLRPKLHEALAQNPSLRPTDYHAALALATLEDGVLWGVGQEIYRYVAGSTPSEADIRRFIEACPPFRAWCYAFVMSWFVGSLRPKMPDDPAPAGRNDLMMAVYLPYCEKFIADESSQATSLRGIATEASINCEVLTFDEFDAALTLKG